MRFANGSLASFALTALLSSAASLGVLACTSEPSHPPLSTTGTNGAGGGAGGGSGGSGGTDDGGSASDGGACSPVLGAFAPATHTATATPGACTPLQITNAYDACLSSTTASASACSTWASTALNVACNSCLFVNSAPTGTAWGPVVYYTVADAQFVTYNAGGCIEIEGAAEEGGTTSTCGQASESLAECLNAACSASCSTTVDEYESCETAAVSDTSAGTASCAGWATAANQACLTSKTSICFVTGNAQTTFTDIAGVFCE